jgi:hypothetical protein
VRRRRWQLLVAAVIVVLGAMTVVVAIRQRPAPAPAPAGCADLVHPVYQSVDLSTGATILSTDRAAVRRSIDAEGWFDRGAPFAVADHPGVGLVAVRLFVNSANGDRLYLSDPTSLASARESSDLVDQGVAFYVLGSQPSCVSPVYALTKDGRHQYAASGNVLADLSGEGWRADGVAFYASTSRSQPPVPESAPGDQPAAADPGQFTIAAVPDTQQEVIDANDPRLADRMRWLIAHRESTNLRFVAHVGDLVNWDTPDHAQYAQARAAMKLLNVAKIPYAIAVGNHDAAATCPGGAACPNTDVRIALRKTDTFNRYFPASSFADLTGSFERGKVDNAYHRFSVDKRSFMVMNLELWPRRQVVDWAAAVIKSHPHDNVILLTHYYLTATGVISTAADYGPTSPAELDRRLVRPNPNVKVVLSGHVGTGASRVVVRPDGNTVAYLMQTFHSNSTNPVRMIRIDLRHGSVQSQVFAPSQAANYPKLATSVTGLGWI